MRLQAAGYRLQATGYRLQAAGCGLRAAGCRLKCRSVRGDPAKLEDFTLVEDLALIAALDQRT